MKFQGVIFDLDGTLVNSIDDLADAMNTVLEKQNFPTHTTDAYRYFVGNGIGNLVLRALPEGHRDETTRSACFAAMMDVYRQNFLNKTRPYAGIVEMLSSLMPYGVKLAVLSNKADELTRQVVRELFGAWNFEAVYGLREELPPKPDPSSAFEICELLGLSPSQVAFVGDSNVDMETAQRAGMHAVGVTWGFRSREELIASGGHAVIDHPRELVPVLLDAH